MVSAQRWWFLLLVLPLLTGCLTFQQRPVDFGLLPKDYVRLGAQRRRIRIYEQGRRGNPAVVFLHGYGSAGSIWRFLMPELVKQGYYTLALDLPGFGRSDKYKGNYDTRYIADQVAEVMRLKGIKKADIIAHSWGSSVTLALALRHPEKVRRLVIHSGWVFSSQIVPVLRWSRVPGIGEVVYALFFNERPGEKFASAVYDQRLVSQRVIHQIREDAKRPGHLAAALAVARGMNFKGMEKKYRTLHNKALLIWGRQDRVSLPFYGRRLESILRNSRLHLLDRCGHIPMIERRSQNNALVVRFLGPASKLRSPLKRADVSLKTSAVKGGR